MPHTKRRNFNTESRLALILMIKKYREDTRYDHENTKTHLLFDLVWLLKTGKDENSCRICTGKL
jgi:hypothetical protein